MHVFGKNKLTSCYYWDNVFVLNELSNDMFPYISTMQLLKKKSDLEIK